MTAFLYPKWTIQNAITPQPGPTWDISGSPSFAVGASNIYFALSAKGQIGSTSSLNYLNIFVGSIDISGNLLWVDTFGTNLQPHQSNAWNPVIRIGPSEEVYLVYMTDGQIPTGRSSGAIDLVLARIDTTNGPRRVSWIKQDSTLNSIVNDVEPSMALDSNYGYLYISDTQQYPVSQIMIRCYNLNGNLLWLYVQPPLRPEYINASISNSRSCVETDNNGSVYVAFQYSGTAPMSERNIPNTQIEIAKFHTILNNVQYDYSWDWTESNLENVLWTPDGYASNPCISYNNNKLSFVFLTSGRLPGLTRTSSQYDIVYGTLDSNGGLRWIRQGLSSSAPLLNTYSLSLYSFGIDLYISAVVHSNQSYDSILVWKIDDFSGKEQWKFSNNETYFPYIYAIVDGFNNVFPNVGFSFRSSSIVAKNNRFYLGSITTNQLNPGPANPRWVTLTQFEERNYDLLSDAYKHLTLNCLNTCS
jgi:hypothetical protein